MIIDEIIKKITRLDLEKLAAELPNVDEEDRCFFIGGEKYYDRQGNYMGKVGETDEIRITTQSTYSNYQYSPSSLAQQSESLSSCYDYSARKNILSSIAADAGVSNFVFTYEDAGVYGHCNSSGVIMFNFNSNCFSGANYYDFYLTFDHEAFHSQQFASGVQMSPEAKELEAYEHTRYHSLFYKASAGYQNMIDYNYHLFGGPYY